jgi:ectoine hydroxylase-related dioxygenase (phytanoyl-CoA dioxygenase family)
MDAVLEGVYETGVAPYRRFWNPEDGPNRLRKVDDAHWSDDTIRELVTHPSIGEWAAAATGAKLVQLWSCQLLVKPAGVTTGANVGWHQDLPYWRRWFTDGVLVAWVAVSDVTEDAGPLRFVRGSHRWGALEGGDFFASGDIDALRDRLDVPSGATWDEVPALLAPGAFSLHHNLVLHGSGPNMSDRPRRSFAVHLRTERGVPLAGDDVHYVTGLDDLERHPVLFRA